MRPRYLSIYATILIAVFVFLVCSNVIASDNRLSFLSFGIIQNDSIKTTGEINHVKESHLHITPYANSAPTSISYIKGRVVDSNSNPLPNLTVVLEELSPSSNWSQSASQETDQNGDYVISGITTGKYRVYFSCYSPDPMEGHTPLFCVPEFFNDVTDGNLATVIEIGENSTVENVNAQLQAYGSIRGHVTDPSGKPLSGIFAMVIDSRMVTFGWPSPSTSQGDYEVIHIPPGDYNVFFSADAYPTLLTEFYNDKVDRSSADIVTVNLDQVVTGIDAQLNSSGKLIGTVVNAESQPLSGVSIYLHYGHDSFLAATTDFAGKYEVGGHDGQWQVEFRPENASLSGEYVRQFYKDAPSLEFASTITISRETTTTIDAQLQRLGEIHGTVTDQKGLPLPNIHAALIEQVPGGWVDTWAYSGNSDANGNYSIKGMLPGTFRIRFTDNRVPRLYSPEYFSDTYNFGEALLVRVTNNITTENIDTQMDLIGGISGKVTTKDGTLFPEGTVQITPYSLAPTSPEGNPVYGYWAPSQSSILVDSSGAFTLTNIDAGNNRLCAYYFPTNGLAYVYRCYTSSSNVENATNIWVSPGETVKDFVFKLPLPGSIQGRVLNPLGEPMPNIKVKIWQDEDGDGLWSYSYWYSANQTDDNGEFSIIWMDPGNYRLSFYDPSDTYPEQFYGGSYSVEYATTIFMQDELKYLADFQFGQEMSTFLPLMTN